MAYTEFPSGSKLQVWLAKLWATVESYLWLAKFMGEDENNIIQVKTDLSKKRGNQINFYLQGVIDSEPVVGDDWLEGRESAIPIFGDAVTIDRARQAAIPKGAMDIKGSPFDFRSMSRIALARWLKHWIEKSWFRVLSGDTTFTFATAATAPTTGRLFWGGNATGTADMASGDWLGLYEIARLKVEAGKADPQVAPLIIDGKEFFVLFIGKNQMFHLRENDTGFATLMNAAYNGAGKDHPVIAGADFVYEGVAVHQSDYILKWNDAGGGTDPRERALLCGAQAGLFALGGNDEWNESSFDYGDKVGTALGKNMGYKKAVFDSKDYGVLAIDTWAPEPVGVAHT